VSMSVGFYSLANEVFPSTSVLLSMRDSMFYANNAKKTPGSGLRPTETLLVLFRLIFLAKE